MKLAEIGETGLIARLAEIASNTSPPPGLIAGIGDDAAAWENLPGTNLATTDSLVEGVHFTLSTTTYFDLGWKALATNLSDIAAMGGIPDYALLSLGLRPDDDTEDILTLFRGISALASTKGVFIAGGNTSRSATFFINMTVFGHTTGPIMRRTAARAGDVIAVTGRLGAAAAGLMLLKQKRSQKGGDSLISAFLKPVPRLEEGQILAREGVMTAIDVSDGLATDLTHICQSSRVGAEIRTASLPLDPAAAGLFGPQAIDLAISGGEDYELLFTAPEAIMQRLAGKLAFTRIGEIVPAHPGKIIFRDECDCEYTTENKGWQHFDRD